MQQNLVLSWVINDDIRFRGVVSESVRAPSIDDLYSGQAQSLIPLSEIFVLVLEIQTSLKQMNPTVVANCLSDPRIAATAALGRFDVDTNQTILLVFSHILSLKFKPFQVSPVVTKILEKNLLIQLL